MSVRWKLSLVLAGLVLLALVPVTSAQSPISSQVQLAGEGPRVVPPDTPKEQAFAVEYNYVGPLTTEDTTTVHLSVQKAPEWLAVDMPDFVEIPVNATGQQASRPVTIAFHVRDGYFPLAFKQNIVTLHLRAEDNGAVNGSTNTKSWALQAGYQPLFNIEVSETPLRLRGPGIHPVKITLENLGNAPVTPGFRFIDIPPGLQVGMASDGGVLGTPARGQQPTTTDAVVVIRDKGSDWTQQTVTLRTTLTPIWGEESTSEDVQIFVVRDPDLVGTVAPWAILGAGAVGGVWYLVRSRRIKLDELWGQD